MSIKESVKYLLSERNPIALRKRKKMRSALTNTTPTFLCPNCIGGILFHELALQFRSPTVNLMMFQPDFLKFVLNMEHYLAQELVFFKHPEYACPCAHLGDLTLHFTHYHSEAEATEKWIARSKRIDRENLFIFLMERDGLNREDILRLGELHVRGLVVFTANAYPEIPYALQISKYASEQEVGNVLAKSYWNGNYEYEQYFDFVKWFNEASGGNYDISLFAK